jgi:hypothetical protein
VDLKGTNVLQIERLRRAAKEAGELRNHADLRTLSCRRQIADRHVVAIMRRRRGLISVIGGLPVRGWGKHPNPGRPQTTRTPLPRSAPIVAAV